jgi:hypothetical protein
VAAYVLAGVATVALGAFSYFAITGKRAENRVDVCAPNCSDSEYESMRNKYLFADIGLGVAVLSSGAAAYLFLADSGPDGPPREAASRVAPAGWQLSLSGRF